MSELRRIGLALEPLDVLFFRDGRPFGAADRAQGGLPTPQSLSGALTTALLRRAGCDFSILAMSVKAGDDWCDTVAKSCSGDARWVAGLHVRGPWLACQSSRHAPRAVAEPPLIKVFLPAPATLHIPKKNAVGPLERLSPLPQRLPGWADSVAVGQAFQPDARQARKPDLRPLWKHSAQATESARGFLTNRGVCAFQCGDDVKPENVLKPEDLYEYDHRTGIEIQPDQLTAAESQIYGARFLSLKPGVVFYAELLLPPDAPGEPLAGIDLIAWGGEGRRARLTIVEPYQWPEAPSCAVNQKPLLVLTTPGLFEGGGTPKCLNGLLAAAAVPEPMAISGWDLARGGPKPNRFAAPAGSVYFLDSIPPHLPDTLSDRPLDRQQGWGCYLQGVWTNA